MAWMEVLISSHGRMRTLLRSVSVLLVLMNDTGVLAQRVTGVRAEQQGKDLVVSYDLEADGPVEVELFVSTDQGKNWQGPLSNCSGDVGKNVQAGTSKRIRWTVLEERELVGEGIRFKVEVRPTTMDKAEVARRPWLNPALTYGAVTDIDGNIYATIQIGEQVWMAENLRANHYRNGDPIPNVTDGVEWKGATSGAWCHYELKSEYETPYGKLYNWYTVVDSRNVCPTGWHVPTDQELNVLTDFLGGSVEAGDALKSTGAWFWDSSNVGATNRSGFSGLPTGWRRNVIVVIASVGNNERSAEETKIEESRVSDGFNQAMRSYGESPFADLGSSGQLWSVDGKDSDEAWKRSLYSDIGTFSKYPLPKYWGLAVRCIRD